MRSHSALTRCVLYGVIATFISLDHSNAEEFPSRQKQNVSICVSEVLKLELEAITFYVQSLKRTQEEVSHLSEEMIKVKKIVDGKISNTPQAIDAYVAMGNSYLHSIRRYATNIETLFEYARKSSNAINSALEPKSIAVTNFLKDLPKDIQEVQITGRMSFYNREPSTPTKIWVQAESIKEKWVNFLNQTVQLQDMIRLVREKNSELMSSSQFQEGLRLSVLDGIDFSLRQSVLMNNKLTEKIKLSYSYFEFGLRGQYGLNVIPERDTEEVTIQSNDQLFREMLSELIWNANDATQEAFKKNRKEYSWDDFAKARVRKERKEIVVQIMDQGNPNAFTYVKGVGNSGTSLRGELGGVGVGRFRAMLIAEFLGFDLKFKPKADNSGSIVEVHIPIPDPLVIAVDESKSSKNEIKQLQTLAHLLNAEVIHQAGKIMVEGLTQAADRKLVKSLALTRDSLPTISSLNRALASVLPDPGLILFNDWAGGEGVFHGTIHELITTERFRAVFGKDNKLIALPFDQIMSQSLSASGNANWAIIGRVNGADSRDELVKRFPGRKTSKEFYWPTLVSAGTVLSPHKVRIEVISVDGIETELNAKVRSEGVWYPLKYERQNEKWVRVYKDHDGVPVPLSCMKCHGYERDFGPTPKLSRFVRPLGWFQFNVTEPIQGQSGKFREIVRSLLPENGVYVEPGDAPLNER